MHIEDLGTVAARLRSTMTIAEEEPLTARASLAALSTQLRLLFIILATNIVALAITQADRAPLLLTLSGPLIALPLFALRWRSWRRLDIEAISDADVRRRLQISTLIAYVVGVAAVAWALGFMRYGGVYGRAHVVFFVAVTCVGCLICLVHLRYGAVLLAAIMAVPTVIVLLGSGNKTFIVIALNYLVVTAVMCAIMLSHYNAFRRLVQAGRDLGAMSETNRKLAQIDSLTGLANRRSFRTDIKKRIEAAAHGAGNFVVGLIDLDGFKPINDLYGHHVGDRVLAEIGRRLASGLEGLPRVARLGGDEFAFIVTDAGDPAAIERLGRRICDVVAAPLELAVGNVRVGASIGMASSAATAMTVDDLIDRADFALYYAKDQCRGTAVMFNEAHAQRIRDRARLEHELRRADLDSELTLVFQPLVDTSAGRVISFEALARWHSPMVGTVSPADFIPAAERIGLITEISETLFRKACLAAADWPDRIRLAFNLSTGDLAAADAESRLCRMVRDCGLAPTRLTFEITETAVMRDFQRSVAVLQALRRLGCRIALDDFGTGFSSLSYVHRLPLDKLKIDQSFVRSLATDGVSFAIVRTIVDLCGNLDISCVTEGVETQEQADLLRSIGCTVMQGFLFGQPMAASVIAANGDGPWSRRWHRERARAGTG